MATAALAVFRSADPDFWLHLAAGRSILAHGLPRQETWCLAAWGEAPWLTEWLFHVALYGARALAGDWAVAAWRALWAALAVAIALRLARTVGGWSWAAVLIAPLALAVERPRMVARGEQWFSVLVVVFLAAFERARRGGRERTLLLLLPLQVLWANSHASWVFGPAIAALFAAVEALDAWRAHRPAGRALRWGGVALLLAGVSAFTPVPRETLTEPLGFLTRVGVDPMTKSIDELQRWSWPEDATDPFTGFLALALLASLLGARRAWRASPALVISALAGLGLALTANRFCALATLVAWPPLAVALAPGGRPWSRRACLGLAGAAAAAGLFWLALRPHVLEPGVAPQWRAFPVRAAALADSLGLDGPVLNTLEYGGYLLWVRGEGHPPLLDGRGRGSAAFRSRYVRAMVDPAAQDSLLGMWPFTHAIVKPPRAAEDYLAVGLSRRPEWALIFADDAALLFVRRDRYPEAARGLGYNLLTPDYARLGMLCDSARFDADLGAALAAELERARASSPWHFKASFWLSQLELSRGHPRQVLALLDDVERVRPGTPGLWVSRGMAYMILGERDSARTALRHALRERTNVAAARQLLETLR